MLETLLQILAWDLPAPEILLEEDGDIGLDWRGVSISINKDGGVAWAILDLNRSGKDLDEFKNLMMDKS